MRTAWTEGRKLCLPAAGCRPVDSPSPPDIARTSDSGDPDLHRLSQCGHKEQDTGHPADREVVTGKERREPMSTGSRSGATAR